MSTHEWPPMSRTRALALPGQPPHPAGERVVSLADADLEGRQDRRGAEEDAGVEGVVLPELLPDRRDPLAAHRHLRRVLDIDEGVVIHPEVDREHDLALLEVLPEQAPEDRRVEDVIGHEQHEVLVEDVPSGDERAGVSGLPGLVSDRRDLEVAPKPEPREERFDAGSLAAGHHEELAEPSLRGGDDRSFEKRQAEDREKRLEADASSQAAAAARGEDHAAHRRGLARRPRHRSLGPASGQRVVPALGRGLPASGSLGSPCRRPSLHALLPPTLDRERDRMSTTADRGNARGANASPPIAGAVAARGGGPMRPLATSPG